MENVIEVKNLTYRYGKRLIYENLSFSVRRGRIFGLLGKNGVGKTTLIQNTAVLQPDHQKIRVPGTGKEP